ncbi:MAG: hypothetical protein ACJ8BC_18950 [Gemmatimonadales bacterium]
MQRPPFLALSGLSRRTALGRAAVVGVALSLGSRVGRVSAQDATAAHPVVGAWRFDFPEDPANLQLAAFHPDGTLVEVIGDVGPGIGAWQATGDQTAKATSIKLDIDLDRSRSAPGTVTDQWTLEVDATGSTLTAEKTFTVRDPDGTVELEARYTAVGTRIEAGTAASGGTPAAGTPAP